MQSTRRQGGSQSCQVNPRKNSERKSPTSSKNAVSRAGKTNPETAPTKDGAKIRAAARDKVSRTRTRASRGSHLQARMTMKAAAAHKVSVRGARGNRAATAARVIEAIKTERVA